tara:strand:- start:2933 stop:3454 length:522 start_codon:yes stop_codon:yes gene_type:complete
MDKIPKRKMKEIEPRLKFKNWFKGLKDFIETEERATILTDTELFTIVNYKLKPKYRVSLGTFERWKAPNTESNVETLDGVSKAEAEEFRAYLAIARVEQKMELYEKVIDANTKNALGARFVMERKFKDMREPPKVQIPSSPTIYIQTANKEQQRIIDGLVNSPTINLEQGDNE